jgi:hypothetical protein
MSVRKQIEKEQKGETYQSSGRNSAPKKGFIQNAKATVVLTPTLHT